MTGGLGDDTAVIRVVLSTTDALPHVAGDAKANIQNWNQHWATANFKQSWTLHYGSCKKGTEVYSELARFEELREICGPWKYPEELLPHGHVVDTPDNCLKHEYPTPNEATDALKIDALCYPIIRQLSYCSESTTRRCSAPLDPTDRWKKMR
ncbi:MAG: uncharacterized protein KVP18_002502 [Porospora cf. gigantea A]|uniref:uncharacterized protein n=1 Tax=Porospora cf. gigantea A TaxID=2853593 RepID=UPI003559C219|nr:MAG: hypothetical protein KVP18_002502 [Porospora cf. gigantea A]